MSKSFVEFTFYSHDKSKMDKLVEIFHEAKTSSQKLDDVFKASEFTKYNKRILKSENVIITKSSGKCLKDNQGCFYFFVKMECESIRTVKIIEKLLSISYPSIEMVYLFECDSKSLYINSDKNKKFFVSSFKLDACINGKEILNYYSTIPSLLQALNYLYPEGKINISNSASIESMLEEYDKIDKYVIEDLKKEGNKFNIFIFESSY